MDVFVAVKADVDALEPDMKKKLRKINLDDTGKKAGDGFASGFRSSVGKMVGGLGGLFAAVKIGDFFGGFVQGARDARAVGNVTSQIIASTGSAANVTAEQVTALAESMSLKNGIDDEIIQKGANLLLTFKNVRNEAGEGANIFDRATQAAADLSAAGFGSVESASTMLGKALNDPLKGISALGRAGVTFTEQQKEQIKILAESGDMLGAQRIILDEVAGQVGGAAEAAADPIDRLKSAGRVLAGQFEGPVLAAVDKFSGFMTGTLVPGVEAAVEAFKNPGATAEGFTGVMQRIGSTARTVFDYFKSDVLPRLREVGSFLGAEVVPRLQSLAQWLGQNRDVIIPLVAALAAGVVVYRTVILVTQAWAAAQALLNGVLAANPVGLVIAALAALVAGLVLAYNKSETFRNIVDSAWAAIRNAVATAWEGYIKPALTALAGFVTGTLIPALQWLWTNVVQPVFSAIGRVISWTWNSVVKPALSALWSYIQNVLIPTLQWLWSNVVQPVFSYIGSKISDTWSNTIKPALEGLWGAVQTVWDWLTKARDKAGEFIDKLKNFQLPQWVKDLKDLVEKVADGMSGAAGAVGRFFGMGDGPGKQIGSLSGGNTLAKVKSILPAGAVVTSTYRDPAHNRRIGGSPTSYHMDRNNPAVDIGGTRAAMDAVYARLAAMGGWRELLYKVAGHWDHVHVAHNGGMVSSSWPTMPGLRADERPAVLQVGEEVVPRGGRPGGSGPLVYINEQHVHDGRDAGAAEVRAWRDALTLTGVTL